MKRSLPPFHGRFKFEEPGYAVDKTKATEVAQSYRGQLLAALARGHISRAEYVRALARVRVSAERYARKETREQRAWQEERERHERAMRRREVKAREERQRIEAFGLVLKIGRNGGEVARTKRGFTMWGVPEQMTIAQAQEIARFIQRAAKVNLA